MPSSPTKGRISLPRFLRFLLPLVVFLTPVDSEASIPKLTYSPLRPPSVTYDKAGNRKTEVETDNATSAELKNLTFSYDAVNRLTTITDNRDAGQSVAYGYDANGNQTSKTKAGVQTRFLFDIRNQLGEVQQGASILGRYGYDYEGRRILKIGAEGRRHYTYDQNSVVTETDQAGVTVLKYDYGLDQLVSLRHRNEGRSFYHLDALGSTVNLTTDAGAARESLFYNAWGQERERVGSSTNHFTFTGHEVDRETGLFYAKARFYDPDIGRFLSQDPFLGDVNEPPSLHRYFYAYDNPLRYVDPTGSMTWEGFVGGLKNLPSAVVQPLYWVYDFWLSVGGAGLDIPSEYLPYKSGLAQRQLERIDEGQGRWEAAAKGAVETPLAVFSFGATSMAQGHYEAIQAVRSGKMTLEQYDEVASQMAGGATGAAILGAAGSRATGRTWTGRLPSATPNANTALTVIETSKAVKPTAALEGPVIEMVQRPDGVWVAASELRGAPTTGLVPATRTASESLATAPRARFIVGPDGNVLDAASGRGNLNPIGRQGPISLPEFLQVRPTWQSSEAEFGAQLREFRFRSQVSFQRGTEVVRGLRGSVRPDEVGRQANLSVDIKNYDVTTSGGRSALVTNIVEQAATRARNLPLGMRQGVIIDARGQHVDPRILSNLIARISRRTGGSIAPDDIYIAQREVR